MAGLIFWIDKEVRELKVQPLASQTGDSAFIGKEIKKKRLRAGCWPLGVLSKDHIALKFL